PGQRFDQNLICLRTREAVTTRTRTSRSAFGTRVQDADPICIGPTKIPNTQPQTKSEKLFIMTRWLFQFWRASPRLIVHLSLRLEPKPISRIKWLGCFSPWVPNGHVCSTVYASLRYLSALPIGTAFGPQKRVADCAGLVQEFRAQRACSNIRC